MTNNGAPDASPSPVYFGGSTAARIRTEPHERRY